MLLGLVVHVGWQSSALSCSCKLLVLYDIEPESLQNQILGPGPSFNFENERKHGERES